MATGCAPLALYKAPFGRPLSSSTTRGAARRTRPLVEEEESGAAARRFVEGWGARGPPLGPSRSDDAFADAEAPEQRNEADLGLLGYAVAYGCLYRVLLMGDADLTVRQMGGCVCSRIHPDHFDGEALLSRRAGRRERRSHHTTDIQDSRMSPHTLPHD